MKTRCIGAALLALTASCAARHRVYVEVSSSHSRLLPAGSTVALLPNPRAENPQLEKELQVKLGRLMRERGYTIAPFEKASYAVTATYGNAGHEELRNYRPFNASDFSYVDTFPTTVAANYRWLCVAVGPVAQGIIEEHAIALWKGCARSSGSTRDLPFLLDYMLIQVFDAFGETQPRKLTSLFVDDKRVKALREP